MAIAAPRRVLAAALALLFGAAIFGVPVAASLSSGGFQDPASESAKAARLLSDKFGQSDQQLVFAVTAEDGVAGPHTREVGSDITLHLNHSSEVMSTSSAWTSPPSEATKLVSKDGKTGLIIAGLKGGENDAQKYARALADELAHDSDGVVVRAGGVAMVYAQVSEQTQRDMLLIEGIAMPISFVVLIWVFGGVVAAALPMAVGALAIVGSMAVLRLFTLVTSVSIFALNLITALGLALAIDSTLLIVSRYRDELASGAGRDEALIRTMTTAGRTVLFSATTVALSLAAMVLFPMYFLKSFAYAGVATVAFVAVSAIVITPAAIVWLGPRLDAFDVRPLIRRVGGRRDPMSNPVEQGFWYRAAKFVMGRAITIGLAVTALLVLLGLPFLGVRWGFPDERVLPRNASAYQVGHQMRNAFADNAAATVPIVIPDASDLSVADVDRYATDLSRVPGVESVSASTGIYVAGAKVVPSAMAVPAANGSALLTVASRAPLSTPASDEQLDRLHQVASPGGHAVLIGGLAQATRDDVDGIISRVPLVLGVIASVTFVLLFLLTGSVVLPVKAIVLNMLSLTATFGALVWIFQEGHLGALGTTSTGTLVANMPVLLFCIAFGLSMDYEVFLVSRIREYWLTSAGTRADNDESVALGLARMGRVITAVALVMAISFAALISAHVSFMRMFGLGLTLAVLVDATLVRLVLVPAFMHVMGQWNWWAPAPLVRLHRRFQQLSETPALAYGTPERGRV